MANVSYGIIKPSLKELFKDGWDNYHIIFFSAPCGCGKTTSVKALLCDRNVCFCSAGDPDFLKQEIPPETEAFVVDDLQYLLEPDQQKELCTLILSHQSLHFVLLGRCRLPGWLMPFRLTGTMLMLETEALLFDRITSRLLLEQRGISVQPSEMGAIHEQMKGYPLALEFLSRFLKKTGHYSEEIYQECRREVFVYLDEAVFHRLDKPTRYFLLCLSPFANFRLDLAKMISGDPSAGKLLAELERNSRMLIFDENGIFRFWDIFRDFLLWESERIQTDAERTDIYRRAALSFELSGDLKGALRYYSLAGDQGKVSSILIRNARLHPGIAHFHEMTEYYYALPREEILKYPALMSGMSMLTALCMDYEASEKWYGELKNYSLKLNRKDPEYAESSGLLSYLDIALPQRGSSGLTEMIRSIFHVISNHQFKVPEFSVTSMLPSIMNGGKDFCEWSKQDDLFYATMRIPVETVLGRDGVGLADCAICESRFEKGKNVSDEMLTLMSRLGDIQAHGTPDIEFAVMGLFARIQVSYGKTSAAVESLLSLREKFEAAGNSRFLGSIDALLTRIYLRTGNLEETHRWLENEAPRNEARLWTMWRYQYLTRAMVLISENFSDEALLLLARLLPYCRTCSRVMDGLHIHILMAICRERLGDASWKDEMCTVLDTCYSYRFIWPVAQYGASVLPLIRDCGWKRNQDFFKNLTEQTRVQAVFYPRFLRPVSQVLEPLSAAETQVLRLICQNLSNAEIGDILNIKLATVKTHVSHILQKMNIKKRSEAREAAERLRLL